MTEHQRKPALDVPDPAKVEKRGVSINAPAPVDFAVPDPWTPSVNGVPEPDAPAGAPGDVAPAGEPE
jgi:hypothetical protein